MSPVLGGKNGQKTVIFRRCTARSFTAKGTEEHLWKYLGRKGQNRGMAHPLPFPPSLSTAHAAGETPAAVPCDYESPEAAPPHSPVQGFRKTHWLQLSGNNCALTVLTPAHSHGNRHCSFSSTTVWAQSGWVALFFLSTKIKKHVYIDLFFPSVISYFSLFQCSPGSNSSFSVLTTG